MCQQRLLLYCCGNIWRICILYFVKSMLTLISYLCCLNPTVPFGSSIDYWLWQPFWNSCICHKWHRLFLEMVHNNNRLAVDVDGSKTRSNIKPYRLSCVRLCARALSFQMRPEMVGIECYKWHRWGRGSNRFFYFSLPLIPPVLDGMHLGHRGGCLYKYQGMDHAFRIHIVGALDWSTD